MIITEDHNMSDLEIVSVFTEFHWDNEKHDKYQSLWKAVLLRLAFDFIGYKVLVTTKSDNKSLITEKARSYVMKDKDFMMICDLADIDAVSFRSKLVDLLERDVFR